MERERRKTEKDQRRVKKRELSKLMMRVERRRHMMMKTTAVVRLTKDIRETIWPTSQLRSMMAL